MKKTTRIFSLLLAVCMLISLFPAALAADRVELNPLTADTQGIQNVETTEPEMEEAPEEESNTPIMNTPLDEDTTNALIDNMPQLVDDEVTVVAEEIENPGVDLTLDTGKVNEIERNTPAPDEIVRVIVVLEDKGLLEQGFTTAQIASNTAKVERQVETLAKRQDAAIAAINRVVEEPVEAKYRYNVALNGLAVEVPYGDLAEIKELPNVKTAFVAPQYEAPVDMSDEVANPNMYAAKDTVGAPQTWEELGYTGTGMRIAIIDSGLDTDHPAFQAAPPLTEDSLTLSEVASVMKSLNAYQQYMSHTSKELTADRLYRSEKVPFGFNYCDDNLELNHDNPSAYDHGSHVAGIAAANAVEGSDVVGVAPDAQILVFKVFGKAGGAYFDDIMAALEDTFRLNADAVNMSLGSAAGFVDEDDYTTHIFKQIMDSDMVVAISAGNSFSAAYMNAYGTNLNLTKDPDIGLVGSPGTYMGATTVASMENGYLMSTYFEVGEHKLTYHDAASIPFTTLAGKELSYVMVPGYGTVEDFEGLDLTGKIAVVKRGSSDPNAPVSFVDKQQNAANAGAVAVIVYDNVEGTLGYMMDAGVIPNVMITMADGATLAAEAKNGEGTMRIHGADDLITVESPEAGLMSSFSSWGVTPDLQLEPDITAPGGNIYSTVDGGGYGTKSGTSMASPAVAGMSALILQHIRDTYNDLYEDEVHALAESLLMSTAEPVLEVTGIPASPRKQGAGSANVYRAISTPGYLTVNGVTPKVSFGDDDLRAGVYNFSFEINNRSDSPLTYVLDGTVLTDQVNLDYAQLGYYFMSETSRELGASVDFTMKNGVIPTEYDYNVDGETDLRDVQALLDAVNGLSAVKAGYDLNGDGKTDTADAQALYEMIQEGFTALNVVEVPANSSVRVYATVTLTDEDKAYMDEYYENGIYVDGFVRCYAQDEGGVDLSLPFMGFYGDWSDARVFDEGWFTDKDVEHNRFYNVFFTQAAGQEFYLGWNPYLTEKYDSFHNVLSPNGDGTLDSIVEIYLCLMRNAKGVRMNISDVNTGASLYQFAAKYVRKSVYYAAANVCLPMIFSDYGRLYDFADAENNDELKLTLDAYLDDGDFNVDESYSLPIYIDTEKPVLYTDSLTYDYDPITDTRKIGFDVSDNHGIAAVITMTAGNGVYERMAMEDKPGERMHVELDVSDYDASFTIAVCDYGCNEAYYNITFYGQENLSTEDFYGYRMTALVPVSEQESVLTSLYNGWNSFADGSQMFQHTAASLDKQPDVYAAEYVDGYIIGIDMHSNIFAMKAGDWTRTPIGKLEVNGVTYPALDMAFDHTTNTLFVLTDEPDRGTPQRLLKVDYLTGEVTDVGVLTDDRNYTDVGITLACDNDGVLYTVYALTHTLGVCDGGALYTIDKETAYATRVGDTGIYPYYSQSMTVDHETNKLYWASYQDESGVNESGIRENCLYEINKETGERTTVGRMMYDDEITGLFKVYHPETPLFPADAALTGLQLSSNDLVIKLGRTAELTCKPLPYYAELGEVTWTSSDKSVATVDNGVITAVGQGKAVITAACGNVTATCAVTVMDFSGEVRLYNTVANRWISMDISDVSKTTIVENAVQFPYGFINAGYYDGNVIATDYLNGFYRLDAETLQGEQVSSIMSNLHGFAMNYQDGFIYAMGGPQLFRVNPYSGETQAMGRIYVQGSPVGGFTIDRSGNAYVVMRSYDEKTTTLCKFPIDASGAPGDVETYVIQDYPIRMYDGSLVYSEENHGLLWSNDYGRLLWIDPSDMENVRIADLGVIENSTLANGMAMNVCLHEIPADEPDVKYAPVSNASIKDTYTMVEGGTALVGLSCTPWNAKLVATYSIDNPRIATVDKAGHITGLSTGSTTLRVNVEGLSRELTATVNVIETAGDIYGYMLGNYMYDFGKWVRFHDYDPSEYEILAATPNFYQVRAGAYYDGYVYAYCATEQDEDYKRSIVKIDIGDYSRETLCFSEYQLRDLEFDYTTGTLYGVAERIFGNNEKDYALIQIDTRTGEEFLVGSTGHDLVAFTIDDQGRLFGLNQSGQLCQLDKNTGKATVVGSIGAYVGSTWQCMYFDHNTGNTYWPQPGEGGRLYTIDLETGKTNPVGTIGKLGMQMSAMFTIPQEEIPVPATMEPTGVKLEEKNVVAVGGTVELSGRALPMTVCDMDGALTWTSDNQSVATVKDGVVTGVSVGTATITATTVNGLSAQCTVTVLDHALRFYSYDQDNCRWISFSKDDPTDYKIEREDAEGESRIFASTLVGDTIYAFDEHMCFYTIDPDTFERTLVSDAHKDMTYNYTIPGGDNYDLTLMPIDLSCDPSTGKLYVAIVGYVKGMYEAHPEELSGLCSLFYEVNMETGAFGNKGNEKPNYRDDTVHVTNLLAENGKLYFVDGFLSGMFRYADLNRWQTIQDALIVQYWGRFMHSRGMVRDPYTGEVYALYDNDPTPGGNDGGHCRLVRLATNNPDATFFGDGFIAEGSVLNGLFVR